MKVVLTQILLNCLKCLFDLLFGIFLVTARSKADRRQLVKHLGQQAYGWQNGVLLIAILDILKEVFK